jgi:pimeloyl-ACP methyl ester carboxylesterase
MNRRGRFVIIGLFVVAGLAGLSSYWAPKYFEAAWFLEDIAAGPAPSSWKKLHKAPETRTVSAVLGGHRVSGDLYVPADAIRGRMVFVPGLLDGARTDPRVVAFAGSLARAGFLTFLPDTAAFEDLRASPDDITAITDAIGWLADADVAGAPKGKVGIAALSYMSGPVMLAASRAPANAQTAFVFFIGGYYSMTDVVRFVTTRAYRLHDSDPWLRSPPAPYAVWAFLKANAQGVDDTQDRVTLERIADQKLADDKADISVLASQLKADGRPVFDLVANRDPDRVEALIAALPPRLRAGLEALDPSRQDLSGFSGDALLVHGKDDPFIPAVESERLAEALGSRAHLYILEQVSHVEVNRSGTTLDQLDMLFAGERLLSYRE